MNASILPDTTSTFSTAPSDFCWATGIEDTFIPQVRPGLRLLDEYELTQHYQLWQSDFDLVAETGIKALRWGIPWYRVQPQPGEWDWRWTDEALDYLVNVKGITPILDLVHYGTPLWLENSFINASYPARVAEYANAVARRYKSLVRYYTPMNEPVVNSNLAGYAGVWPPYLVGNDGWVKVILSSARGVVETVRALKSEQPDLVTIQVEALWRAWTREEGLRKRIEGHNQRQFLAFDLATGRVGSAHPLCELLYMHGVADASLAWFQEHAVSFDIFGANFYPWGYGPVRSRKDGSFGRIPIHVDGGVLADLVAQLYARYELPIMITETSSLGDYETRGRWMDETIAAVRALRQDGMPVVGYTWFPFFSMFGWDYRTGRRPLERYLIHLGLYDAAFDPQGIMRRHETPLVERYQRHMAQAMPPLPESRG